jgi:phage baseplate assembly protein W
MIRYRNGIEARTGRPLSGRAHLEQSIVKIVMTIPTERVMRLDFGMNPTRHIGRNISAALAARFYRDVIVAVHRWEPEYRIRRLQLVTLGRIGSLGVLFEGTYYPEGRFGNYAIAEAVDLNLPLSVAELRGVA